MSKGYSPMALATMVSSQGLTPVLEALIEACDTQAHDVRRFRMHEGLSGEEYATWDRRARLWERCAGRLRDAAGSPAVRELRRQLRDDVLDDV